MNAAASPSILAVHGITKAFKDRVAVDALSFEVQRGEIVTGAYPLLDREFTAEETGEYRIHGRLYATTDGRLLQEVDYSAPAK